MSKQDFIALADAIRQHNRNVKAIAAVDPVEATRYSAIHGFTQTQINALADFCQSQNPRFMRERWLDYIAGECGSNGGKVKRAA